MAAKNTCILYGDIIEYVEGDDALSDAQVAELYRAQLAYINGRDVVIKDPEVKGIWRFVKSRIDKDNKVYEGKCKQLQANVNKSTRKQANRTENKQIDSKTSKSNRNDANRTEIGTDNDNDNDNDNDITPLPPLEGAEVEEPVQAALEEYFDSLEQIYNKPVSTGKRNIVVRKLLSISHSASEQLKLIKTAQENGWQTVYAKEPREPSKPKGDMTAEEYIEMWGKI